MFKKKNKNKAVSNEAPDVMTSDVMAENNDSDVLNELTDNNAKKSKAKKKPKKEKKAKDTSKKGKKNELKVPKTVQETIPYLQIFKNGIIEIKPGVYSKTYKIADVNFKIATEDEQENIFSAYQALLNSYDHTVMPEFTIFNRAIDESEFSEHILVKPQDDDYNDYRTEFNDMLLAKMGEGKNNIRHEKYLTLTVEEKSTQDAFNTFARLDGETQSALKKIGSESEPLTLTERMSILYDIYKSDSEDVFLKKACIDGKEVSSFDFEHMHKLGLNSKDVIGPDSIEFNFNYFKSGEKFGRTLFISDLPPYMSPEIIPDISALPINMLVSVYYEPMRQDKARKLVQRQRTNINSNILNIQKKSSQSGYDPSLAVPKNLMKAQEEADLLIEDMTSRNQKIFWVTMVITQFADSLEELDKDTKSLEFVANKYLCQFKKLSWQQEAGFNTSLPLGNMQIHTRRLLTSESGSVFIPFSTQELTSAGGFYYGLNAVSRNLVLYNRKSGINYNGFILGTSGSGKSFSAKREIVNVLLYTRDQIYVVDPDGEYSELAKMFGGQVIEITLGGDTHVNPLDLNLGDGKEDPVANKSDFIMAICEVVIGGRYGLTPIQKSVIDRVIRKLYQPYLEHLARLGKNVTHDYAKSPTLKDFFNLLMSQDEPEAMQVALSLEMYCTGSLDVFAYTSNVNLQNRFVVYNIKNIGANMKELGLQVCLDNIWNNCMDNRLKNLWTWMYMDEFHLLVNTESSQNYIVQMYKRARKYNGVPTGITQNITDLLKTDEVRVMLSNACFIEMLNQAPLDRTKLGELLNISPTQMSYITNSDPGQGLIYTGKTIVPFIDQFPTDTKLYHAMSTKSEDAEDLKKKPV